MVKSVYITEKVSNKLDTLIAKNTTTKEAMATVLLLLAMTDENLVKQAVDIIAMYNHKGSQTMEDNGW